MATTKDSPTAGEIRQDDVPMGGEVIASTEGQETNFPPAPEDQESAPEAVEDERPKEGEVWAVYTGPQPSQRTLTVTDLRSLGDSKATEPLTWDRNNRFRLEVSNVHPMVLEYIEHLDGNFRVVRPE
jgi:hypothetical protein